MTEKGRCGTWRTIVLFTFALVSAWGEWAIAAPPTCAADTAIVSEDSSILIDVLANDADGGVPPLTLSSVGNPSHGTASIQGGEVRYTPSENFCGTDTFSYTAQNADGTDTALVTVTVTCQNDSPTAMDAVVTTSEDSATTFMLEAQDPDIDPMMPYVHPLGFEIIEGPNEGNVYGDFTAVTYTTPHRAMVGVTYTPNPGFIGTDGFLFRVTDPYGMTSTGRVNIEVRPAGVPVINLGATSKGALTFSGSPLAVELTSTEFTAFYQVGTALLEAQTQWEQNVWEEVSLELAFPLGEAIHVDSALTFDPSVPTFDSWNMITQFDLFGVHVSHTFRLGGATQTESSSALSASWSGQGVSCWFALRFAGCETAFAGATLSASWLLPDCSMNLWTSLNMGTTGFQNMMFSLRDIQLPLLFFSPSLLSLNVDVTFTTESKTVSPSLQLRSIWAGCLQPLFRLDGAGGNIEGVALYGLRLQWVFPGGVSIWADTSLDEWDNASVTGYSDYFERFVVSVPIDSCCGVGGQWQAGIYFQRESVELFDWGMTVINIELPLADQLILKSEIIWRSVQPPAVDPAWEWEIGWTAFWG